MTKYLIDRFDCSFRPSSPGFPSFAVGKKGKDRESGDIGSKRGKGEEKMCYCSLLNHWQRRWFARNHFFDQSPARRRQSASRWRRTDGWRRENKKRWNLQNSRYLDWTTCRKGPGRSRVPARLRWQLRRVDDWLKMRQLKFEGVRDLWCPLSQSRFYNSLNARRQKQWIGN